MMRGEALKLAIKKLGMHADWPLVDDAADLILDVERQTATEIVDHWERCRLAHAQSAEQHAADCSGGLDCGVTRTKMHIAGLIEAQLSVIRAKFGLEPRP